MRILLLPVRMFIWEGQRVQESSVQQHELVVDPSDLQWSERGEEVINTTQQYVCIDCMACSLTFHLPGLKSESPAPS